MTTWLASHTSFFLDFLRERSYRGIHIHQQLLLKASPATAKMRRIPSQVPDTVSRLLKSTLILSPPIWYLPVLSNPPPILPVRRSRPRPTLNQAESTKSKQKGPKTRPQSIVYAEDRLRRQFFRDFPFEAMRPVSLVEGREVRVESEVEGPEWTGLEQRGAYPSVEEYVRIHTIPRSIDVVQLYRLCIEHSEILETTHLTSLRQGGGGVRASPSET